MTDPSLLAPVLGALLLPAVVVFVVLVSRKVYPRQYGRANARARRSFTAAVTARPKGERETALRWHDHASLTRIDVVEILYEHGWYYVGQDPDGDGWPLFATRDRRRALSTEPPPTREQRLVAELQAAGRTGAREVVVDLVPYLALPPGRIAEVAERAGWSAGRPFPLGCVPRQQFVRRGAAP